MPVQMSPNMKRIRRTIIGGVIYEGNYEQAMAQRQANMGGIGTTDSLSGGGQEDSEAKEE